MWATVQTSPLYKENRCILSRTEEDAKRKLRDLYDKAKRREKIVRDKYETFFADDYAKVTYKEDGRSLVIQTMLTEWEV